MKEAKLALVPQPPEPLAEPVVLGGRYRLIRQLVEGGMGSVWYAEHLTLRSPVAVKLITLDEDCSEEIAQRFLLEARAGAALRSPHVVQILDYGLHEGRPYLVMELLEGESLAAYLDRAGPLPASVTARIISQVARALTRAHDAGIVHRDLKPANIFLVADENELLVKLLDFGIAKSFKDSLGPSSAPLSRAGTFIGTPQYASPEQIEGVSTLDHRTDIWSMGIVAFECLLNRSPFGGHVGKIMVDICSQPLPVPSEHGPVPAGFDAWFSRACARDPKGRFQSAAEAAAALAQLCLSKEDDALLGTEIVASIARRRRRRSGTTFAKLAAVLLSMALAGGAVALTLLESAQSAKTTTTLPLFPEPVAPERVMAAATPAEPAPALPPAAASLVPITDDGAIDPASSEQPSSLEQLSHEPPLNRDPASAAVQPSALEQPRAQPPVPRDPPPRAAREARKTPPPGKLREPPRARRAPRAAPDVKEPRDPVEPNEFDFGI